MSAEDIARDPQDDPGPVCGSGPLPLEGIRVLDLNSGAAPHCGQFLAVFGAEVVLVEPPSAKASRSDLAWAAFNAGKKSVALDVSTAEGRLRLDELVGTCDVVIDSDRTGISDFDPRAGNPSRIHITVSDFGLSGPRAGWTASELVAQAAGGLLYLSGDSDHPPAEVGFPVATSVSGGQAACAVLIALAQRRRTGEGARIDLSRQESVANLQFTNHFTARAFGLRGGRGDAPLTTEKGQIRRRTIWDCADGTVTWNLWTGRGWGRKNIPFFEWLRDEGVPEAEELLARDWDHMDRSELTPELLEHVHGVVGDFFKRNSKAAVKREALARKLLLYVIHDMEDVATDEQLLDRRAFREIDLPGEKTVASVGTPVRSSAYKVEISRHVPTYGEHTKAILEEWRANPPAPTGASERAGAGRLPLEGLKVLDFCWLVVGPLTTKYLSMFGADVARIEFRGRPCAVRLTGPYPKGRPSMNGGTTFVSINTGKRSVGLDMAHPLARDVLFRMAEKADLITENFTPGVMQRAGLTYEAFRKVRPDTIMMSLSMQGQTGKRAAQPGLGNHLQALCGIDYVTGHPEGLPQGPSGVLPDFLGPWISVTALLAALEHRHRTGEGQYIDISQYEAIMTYMQPLLLEYGLTGVRPERRGNASLTASPHGVYPLRGEDRWIAIEAETDEQWRRMHALLPSESAARFPAELSVEQRIEMRADLDKAIAVWSADHDGEALMTRLQEAGVPAYTVSDGLEVIADPQLEFRDHFVFREHGSLGMQAIDAPSFRFDNIEPRFEAGPLYGAQTAEVLEAWLGMDADEMAELIAAEAIVL